MMMVMMMMMMILTFVSEGEVTGIGSRLKLCTEIKYQTPWWWWWLWRRWWWWGWWWWWVGTPVCTPASSIAAIEASIRPYLPPEYLSDPQIFGVNICDKYNGNEKTQVKIQTRNPYTNTQKQIQMFGVNICDGNANTQKQIQIHKKNSFYNMMELMLLS